MDEMIDAEILDDSEAETEDSKGFPVIGTLVGVGLTALATTAVVKRKQIAAAAADFQAKRLAKKAEKAEKKAEAYKAKMIEIQKVESEEDSEE